MNYFGKQLYGDYNPYSQGNLQSGGMMGQTPFEEVLRKGQGDGSESVGTAHPKASTETFGLGPNQGQLAEARAFSDLTPGLGLAKDIALDTFNPASYLNAIPNAAMSAAGVERPEGFGGWALSKVPALAGTLALGPVGGLLGGIAGTPFADILSDAMDTRENEEMREDFEGTFGQFGGRRGYADVQDSIKEKTAMMAPSMQDAVNMMQARSAMQIGGPEQRYATKRDYDTLSGVLDRMNEVKGLMTQSRLSDFQKQKAGGSGAGNVWGTSVMNPNFSSGFTNRDDRDSGGSSGGDSRGGMGSPGDQSSSGSIGGR